MNLKLGSYCIQPLIARHQSFKKYALVINGQIRLHSSILATEKS